MPTPSLILWIDSSSSRLVSSWNSSATASNLIFNQGDSVGIELHRVNAINGNFMSEIEFPETGNISLAIGNIETAPTSGSYVISYNGESTGAISYNATALNIDTALNALTSIIADGGVSVSLTGNVFRVIWNNNGARSHAISVGSNNLFPSSSVGIDIVRTGTSTVRQITQLHIKQSPVAICESWVNQDDSVINCTQIHTPTFVGDVKVWRVSISPQPKGGNFLLSYQNGATTYRTQPLDVSSNSSTILNALSGLNSNLESFTVTQSGTYSWDISTSSSDVLNFTATGSGIISFKSKYGILNLNTIEVQDLLAGSSSATAYIEVQLATDTTTTTLYQGNCIILNDLIDNDGATVVSRGDVMPVESVVRYDTSQSLTGSQKTQARTNIGALGSSELVPFTNKDIELETRLVVAEGNLIGTEQKNALNGSSSPSGTNVFITTSAFTSALTSKANVIHTHLISDVTSLQYSLDTLQNNINAINNVSLTANNTFTGTQRFNNKVGINIAPDTAIGLSLDATGVLFSDGSIQTTAALPATGGTVTGVTTFEEDITLHTVMPPVGGDPEYTKTTTINGAGISGTYTENGENYTFSLSKDGVSGYSGDNWSLSGGGINISGTTLTNTVLDFGNSLSKYKDDSIVFPDATTQTTAYNPVVLEGYLPLTGGTMTGAIRFDTVGTQSISKGSFDNGHGAYNGISLICANDVELNWQAGILKAKYNGSFVPIYTESNICAGDYTYGSGGLSYSHYLDLGGGDSNTTTTHFTATGINNSDTIGENDFSFTKLGISGRSNDSEHFALNGDGVSGGDSYGINPSLFALTPDIVSGHNWSISPDNGIIGIPLREFPVPIVDATPVILFNNVSAYGAGLQGYPNDAGTLFISKQRKSDNKTYINWSVNQPYDNGGGDTGIENYGNEIMVETHKISYVNWNLNDDLSWNNTTKILTISSLPSININENKIIFSDGSIQTGAPNLNLYATIGNPTFTGNVILPSTTYGTTQTSSDSSTKLATTAFVKAQNYITSSSLTGYATQSYVTSQGYITSSALTPYLTSATASTIYFPKPAGTTSQYLRGDGTTATFPTIPSISGLLVATNNLSDVSNTTTARTNLGLGSMATETASNYALLAGATFTGKVNIGAGATTSPLNIGAGITPSGAGTAGDLWIGGTNLAYKDSTNTLRTTVTTSQSNTFTNFQAITQGNSANPSLAVTQTGAGGGVLITNTGAGYSFKVEDSASPDATPFAIDQNGRTGIGVAPDATSALNVDSTGIKFNSSTAQTVPFLPPPSDGNYYVYRNGAWTMATIYVSGNKNYLTI